MIGNALRELGVSELVDHDPWSLDPQPEGDIHGCSEEYESPDQQDRRGG
jgi:hypothetical protein